MSFVRVSLRFSMRILRDQHLIVNSREKIDDGSNWNIVDGKTSSFHTFSSDRKMQDDVVHWSKLLLFHRVKRRGILRSAFPHSALPTTQLRRWKTSSRSKSFVNSCSISIEDPLIKEIFVQRNRSRRRRNDRLNEKICLRVMAMSSLSKFNVTSALSDEKQHDASFEIFDESSIEFVRLSRFRWKLFRRKKLFFHYHLMIWRRKTLLIFGMNFSDLYRSKSFRTNETVHGFVLKKTKYFFHCVSE